MRNRGDFVMITGVSNYSSMRINSANQTVKAEKPVWNGTKPFKYLEDMNNAALTYGAKAKQYYVSKTMGDGELSVADLKKQIEELFSDYTLTDHEPRNVVEGKHYLYVDDSQLKKMAADPAYRAKVYGLMDREMTVGKEFTLTYSDGRNVTSHITGSVFSLCEANKKYAGADGIPYLGSCTTDQGWSSSESHPQVKSMSFIYDNLDPAKSARKNRTVATKAMEKKTAQKITEKKQAERKAEKKKEKAKRQEDIDEKRRSNKEQLEQRLEEWNTHIQTYSGLGKINNCVTSNGDSIIRFDART